MAFTERNSLAPSSPVSGHIFRRCKIHFKLRAAALLPFLRGIQRFCTASHPAAQVACYVATCLLPRPDFHRLAHDDFQDALRFNDVV